MLSLRRILVAVADPGARRSAALSRAAELAARSGARITLFHSLYSPYLASEQFFDPEDFEPDVASAVGRVKAELERLARPLVAAGADLHVRCRWDYPVHESIVREALREKSELVVLESHRHRAAARLVLGNTDWQLIRLCSVPLLMVKSTRSYAGARVLACVDPLHAHAKPASLDDQLLARGAELAEAFGGRLHAAHFLDPTPLGAGQFADPLPLPVGFGERRVREAREAFRRLVARNDLGPRRAHLRMGSPIEELPRLVAELDPHVVVMGAVSRSGLKRAFIGSTAEQVIDRLACDLLVVKPPGFQSTVPRRPRPRPVMLPTL